ncbi:MAG: hypothetical protein ACREQF_12760 [Candidatus Binataceae bacterium]
MRPRAALSLTVMGTFLGALSQRRTLLVWCAIGLLVIALKAYLDRTALKYPDVALRAGDDVYYIPRDMVGGDKGFRADFQRLAGCWDAREQGLLPAAAAIADCGVTQSLPLKIAAKDLGFDAEIGLRGRPLKITFWPDYAPPGEHLPQLVEAWGRKGAWADRRVVLRADWMLFRVESAASPWVHLLTHEPQKGDEAELASLYAGRCYRPEPMSDAGITCTFVLRIGPKAAIEYELGPDEMLSFVPIRDALVAKTASWMKPVLTAATAPAH